MAGYDEDDVDPDIEQQLYSLIYYLPADEIAHTSQTEGISSASSSNSNTVADTDCTEIINPKKVRCNDDCSTNVANRRSKLKKKFDAESVQSVTDSDRSSVILCSSPSTSSSSLDYEFYLPEETNITANFDTSAQFDPHLNHSRRGTGVLPVDALETMSIEEIRSALPSDPNLWQVCEEDIFSSEMSMISSRGRYYARRMRCKRCNEEGHRQADCPKKDDKTCILCGDKTHRIFRCKNKPCIICMKFGHFTINCPKTRKAICSMRCTRCSQRGHLIADCPETWRQFRATIASDLEFEKLYKMPVKKVGRLYCYNCGRKGHGGQECTRETNYNAKIIAFQPKITSYDSLEYINAIETESPYSDLVKGPIGVNKHIRFLDNSTVKPNRAQIKANKLSKKKQKKADREALKDLLNKSQNNFRQLLKKDLKKKSKKFVADDAPTAPPTNKTKKIRLLKQRGAKRLEKITQNECTSMDNLIPRKKRKTKLISMTEDYREEPQRRKVKKFPSDQVIFVKKSPKMEKTLNVDTLWSNKKSKKFSWDDGFSEVPIQGWS